LDEELKMAKRRFGVETLLINPGNMSLSDQIGVAQRATVTFSPCGEVSFFNAFLPEGATAIIIDYWETVKNSSASMEGYAWQYATRQHTLRYMVKRKAITILPLGNATRADHEDYRNYGATTLDVERAAELIYKALYMSEHVFNLGPNSFNSSRTRSSSSSSSSSSSTSSSSSNSSSSSSSSSSSREE